MLITLLILTPVVLILSATMIFGREKTLSSVFGDPDLGRTVFSELKRPFTKNHCLACPADFCVNATPDIVPEIYALSAAELREALRTVLNRERRLERVHTNDPIMRERYIQRSELFRFPDTIQVEYIILGSKQSTIALYSRSKIGFGDGGVNRARIKRWLKRLDKEAR